jgi:hypothetical protein
VEYFYDSEKQANEDDSSEDLIYKCYEAVLDSKVKDETLVSLCPIFVEQSISEIWFVVTDDFIVLNYSGIASQLGAKILKMLPEDPMAAIC